MNKFKVTVIKGTPCEISLKNGHLYLQRAAKSLRAIVYHNHLDSKTKLPSPMFVVWVDDSILKIECDTLSKFPDKIRTWDRITKPISRVSDFTDNALIQTGLSFTQFMKRVN